MSVISVEIEKNTGEMEIVNMVVDNFHTSERWRDGWDEDWENYYKDYRFYRDETEHTMRHNIFVPYVFAIVESVVPKMLNTVFSSSPMMSVVPREEGDEDLAWIIEKWLDYAFQDDKLDLYTSVESFFKDAAIYGTSFAKVLPRFREGEILDLDYVDFDPIELTNIFPDPRARSLKRAEWIIHRDWVPYHKIVELAEKGIYKKSIVEKLKDKFESAESVDEERRRKLSEIEKEGELGYNYADKTVEVLEYWDRKEIITVAARDTLLKREKNPINGFLPFVSARYTPVPHEFYGIGVPEMARTLQQELNDIRNQRMDNVNIIINRMFIANKYADINFEDLISYPGNVILSDDVDAIKPLQTPDVTRSIYMEEERLVSDIQNVTGEWEYGRGQTPPHKETATGIIRLQQAANIRFDALVKRLEFTALRSLAKLFVWYAYNFLQPETLAKIVGEEQYQARGGGRLFELDPEEVLRQYHIIPMGSSTTAIKETQAQQAMGLFQALNGDPLIDQVELRRRLLVATDTRGIDRLLKTMEQVQMEQQQMAAAGPPPGAQLPAAGEAAVAGEPPMTMPPEGAGEVAMPTVAAPVEGGPPVPTGVVPGGV